MLTEWKLVFFIAFFSLLLFPFLLCSWINLCEGIIKFSLGHANFLKPEDFFLMASCEIFGWLLNVCTRPLCQPFFCVTIHPCRALTVLTEEGWASHVVHPQRTSESHEWGSWKMRLDLGLIATNSLRSDSVGLLSLSFTASFTVSSPQFAEDLYLQWSYHFL